MKIAYQIVGWYKSMKPENRKSRTISDGVMFSDRKVAEDYAAKNMAEYEIREVENPTPATVDYLLPKKEKPLHRGWWNCGSNND